MEKYTFYHVWTTQIKSGKSSEAKKWWEEKGKATYESLPGVESAKAYGTQFGLGGGFIEIWLQLKNYAVFDLWDEDLDANPQKYVAFGETQDLFESGSSRIMGDWPESHWAPPKE